MMPWLGALALLSLTVGCHPSGLPRKEGGFAHAPPTTAEWRDARRRLKTLRVALTPTEPRTMNVELDMKLAGGAWSMRSRGAIAVHPAGGLRIVMLGPGGTTAFDLWACEAEFRLAIPAVDHVVRGDARTPSGQLRGLPVAFLRWWFLAPMSGRLLNFAAADEDGWWRFVLRDGDSVVDVRGQGPSELPQNLHVIRRVQREVHEVHSDGKACGRVRYQLRPGGVVLETACEGWAAGPPPSRAFHDPDRPSRSCGALSSSVRGERD
jgi:hypothetical protein